MRNISKCKARKVKDIENRHFYIEKWTLKVSISSVDLNFLHDMGEKSTFFPSSVEKAITFVGVFRKVFTAPNVKNTKHFAIVKLCKFEISPPSVNTIYNWSTACGAASKKVSLNFEADASP